MSVLELGSATVTEHHLVAGTEGSGPPAAAAAATVVGMPPANLCVLGPCAALSCVMAVNVPGFPAGMEAGVNL